MTDTICSKPLSLTGRRWELPDVDSRVVETIMQRHDLPYTIAEILVKRQIALEEITKFLQPTLRNDLPDPMHLLDMEKAANRIADAIIAQETIGIFGDYDVDGATSTSLLIQYFRMLDCETLFTIPDRIQDGYGPNIHAFEDMQTKGAQLIITVDCGTNAFEVIQQANLLGIDTIIVDHHQSEMTLPQAFAIINPNRFDETSPLTYIAAVGVSFLLAIAITTCLRNRNYFLDKTEPDLLSLIDLVALGTVCDVMPLQHLNRTFVTQGLKQLQQRKSVGLNALLSVANVNEQIDSYHLGFMLGPRINAGGRVGEAALGTKLLIETDFNKATAFALSLDRFNQERKAIEHHTQEDAIAQVTDIKKPVLVVAKTGWHEGVIGIVAGRLKDQFKRPSCVIAIKDGIGKGSARSISGIDIGALIHQAVDKDILLKGGGHKMAGGFSIKEEKIPDFTHFLEEKTSSFMANKGPEKLSIDASLTCDAISIDLCKQLSTIGPFGVGNPTPKLCLHQVYIQHCSIVGGDHLRLQLTHSGSGKNATSLKAMAFRSVNTPLGNALQSHLGKSLDMVITCKIDQYQGNQSLLLIIEDLRIAA